MKLTYEKLDPSLPDLEYAKEGDAGFDLCASLRNIDSEDAQVWLENETIQIPSGYRFNIPDEYELQIRPRSGLASEGIFAQFGTVDSGYRGEVKINLTSLLQKVVKIRHGDRIAQAVLAPVTRAELQQGVVDTDTERGEDGFGSTGR